MRLRIESVDHFVYLHPCLRGSTLLDEGVCTGLRDSSSITHNVWFWLRA